MLRSFVRWPFDKETGDVVAEVVVLPGSANIAARFDITLTIGLRERDLAVLHHGNSCAWHLPVGHDIGGKTIKLGSELNNRRIVRFMSHAKASRLEQPGALGVTTLSRIWADRKAKGG